MKYWETPKPCHCGVDHLPYSRLWGEVGHGIPDFDPSIYWWKRLVDAGEVQPHPRGWAAER